MPSTCIPDKVLEATTDASRAGRFWKILEMRKIRGDMNCKNRAEFKTKGQVKMVAMNFPILSIALPYIEIDQMLNLPVFLVRSQ